MKRKVLHIIIIFCLTIFLLIDEVRALGLSVFLTPSTTNVQTSSEVMVKVKISNLDVGNNGINTFTASLNYDTDVFEQLTASDIVGLNNWTVSYTPESGKVTLFKTTFVNSEEEIFQIMLKTKSNVSKSSGIVSLKNIIVSNGDDEISATEVNTNITIGSGIVITLGNTTNNNTSNTSNTTNNSVIVNNNVNMNNNSPAIVITNNANVSNYANTNTYVSNKVNNTISETNNTINNKESITNNAVPYTGTRENVRIALIVLLVVAGYIYIKFEKLNKVC